MRKVVCLLVLAVFTAGCHRTTPVLKNADVGTVIGDTAVVVVPIADTSVVAFFKDTSVTSVFSAEGKNFKLQTPGQRQSLHATLRKSARCGKLESRVTIDICSVWAVSVPGLGVGY